MLRRMLIALSLYPTFIHRCQKWCDLNPSIPLDLQNQVSFLERYELPKLTKLSINALMELSLNAMVSFAQLNLLGRISFDYSPDFRTLFVNLHRVFTSYFLLRSQCPNESNNPVSVVQKGEFIGDIYIKPQYSIQYIILNFNAVDQGVNFEEFQQAA